MRAGRGDTDRSRRKEDSVSMPPQTGKPDRPRLVLEKGALESSSKRPEKPRLPHWITHRVANNRFQGAQQYRQQPGRSMATQADTANVFETARAASLENRR